MDKGGIKSTWILPNCRQQTNVGGLSFQTNKQTNQETKSLLPQVKKKKGKKSFKFSILSVSIMINTSHKMGFFNSWS